MVNYAINPSQAANIYQQNSNFAQRPGIPGNQDESFAEVLKGQTEKVIDTLRAGEQATAKGITGEANIVDVVQAVNKADMTLQTVISFRDRIIQAYQDIISMPI